MNLELTLEQLIARSGDSKLLWYRFINGKLEFELDMDEFDASIVMTISTAHLRVNPQFGSALDTAQMFHTCRLELLDLTSSCQTSKGRYLPPQEFDQLMKEVRKGIGLAYGESVEKVRFLFRVKGYGELIACLVAQQSDIHWKLNSEEG